MGSAEIGGSPPQEGEQTVLSTAGASRSNVLQLLKPLGSQEGFIFHAHKVVNLGLPSPTVRC